jgi:GGDEF domain-containing protein
LALGESTAWIVVALSAWAFLLVSFALVLHARARGNWRRAWPTASLESTGSDSSIRLESDQRHDTRAAERPVHADTSVAQTELRLMYALLPGVTALDLETLLARGLEAAAEVGSASASVIALARRGEKPLIATLGMTNVDSCREQVGLPPESGQARAVQLAYSYPDDVAARDAFPLRSGLAVPIASEEDRLGTLAIYWRRVQHQVSDEELERLEAVARALAWALESLLRLEDARPFELDGATGLLNAQAMRDALSRECARARRYDRCVALILLRLDVPPANELLASAGHILGSAVRDVDLPCYLGEGCFAVILPEARLSDAQRLGRRLGAALDARLDGLRLGASRVAIVELRADEDPVSLVDRARRDLAQRAQDGTPPQDEASRKLDLANA